MRKAECRSSSCLWPRHLRASVSASDSLRVAGLGWKPKGLTKGDVELPPPKNNPTLGGNRLKETEAPPMPPMNPLRLCTKAPLLQSSFLKNLSRHFPEERNTHFPTLADTYRSAVLPSVRRRRSRLWSLGNRSEKSTLDTPARRYPTRLIKKTRYLPRDPGLTFNCFCIESNWASGVSSVQTRKLTFCYGHGLLWKRIVRREE